MPFSEQLEFEPVFPGSMNLSSYNHRSDNFSGSVLSNSNSILIFAIKSYGIKLFGSRQNDLEIYKKLFLKSEVRFCFL